MFTRHAVTLFAGIALPLSSAVFGADTVAIKCVPNCVWPGLEHVAEVRLKVNKVSLVFM